MGTALVKTQQLSGKTLSLQRIQTALGLQCVLLCPTVIKISKYYPCWISRDPANPSGLITLLAYSNELRAAFELWTQK